MSTKNNPPPTPAPTSIPNVPQTEADKIWLEIKDRPIEMFALPGKTIKEYCRPVPADPTRLFVVLKFSGVLPALEETCGNAKLGNMFDCELVDKFVAISRRKPVYKDVGKK